MIAGVDGTGDPNGHGTAMAAIVAAGVDNATGIAGVGYRGCLGDAGQGARCRRHRPGLRHRRGCRVRRRPRRRRDPDVVLQPRSQRRAPGRCRLRLVEGRRPRGGHRQRRLDRRDVPRRTRARWSASPPPTATTPSGPAPTPATTPSSPRRASTSPPARRRDRHLRLGGDRRRHRRPAEGRPPDRVERRARRPTRPHRRRRRLRLRHRQRPGQPRPGAVRRLHGRRRAGRGLRQRGPIVGPYVAAANVNGELQGQSNPACASSPPPSARGRRRM